MARMKKENYTNVGTSSACKGPVDLHGAAPAKLTASPLPMNCLTFFLKESITVAFSTWLLTLVHSATTLFFSESEYRVNHLKPSPMCPGLLFCHRNVTDIAFCCVSLGLSTPWKFRRSNLSLYDKFLNA